MPEAINLKFIYCIYMIRVEKIWREGSWWEQEQRRGRAELRGCSLGDLRVFIYAFLLEQMANTCWGRHFFPLERKDIMCVGSVWCWCRSQSGRSCIYGVHRVRCPFIHTSWKHFIDEYKLFIIKNRNLQYCEKALQKQCNSFFSCKNGEFYA